MWVLIMIVVSYTGAPLMTSVPNFGSYQLCVSAQNEIYKRITDYQKSQVISSFCAQESVVAK